MAVAAATVTSERPCIHGELSSSQNTALCGIDCTSRKKVPDEGHREINVWFGFMLGIQNEYGHALVFYAVFFLCTFFGSKIHVLLFLK